jgi:multidrug resistance protein MdtO
MASVAQSIPAPASPLNWFREFLREELAPYPGRGALVTRMVAAATIVMILTMTFRIPYGAYGAVYALTISRENPLATLNAVKTIVAAFAMSVLYVLVGAMLFLHDPTLRLFWVIGTFFVMFYALSAMANYTAAARFGYLLIITIPLWDEHVSASFRVENTLWAFAAITLASVITAATEVVFAARSPQDDVVQSIADRLAGVEELLDCYKEDRSVDSETTKRLTRLAMVGTSRLRRVLQRSGYSPHYAEQMGAVVALAGRLLDVAVNLMHLHFDVSDSDRQQIRTVARNVAGIRTALLEGRIPSPIQTSDVSSRVPLMHELETTVSMIPAVFTGSDSLSAFAPRPAGGDPPFRLFVPDALSNVEHIKFGLKGCLAASLCYIFYDAKDWPGISTAVTTCFLTALSTRGSSHQKQILRIAGAIVGGIVAGIGAQMFILPYLDSIGGFTLLFLAVTIPAAWIITSGPRLSYLGVQIAVAFYLINLSEFRAQTSLELGRDRVLGILLGLFMMWLTFDRLWGAPAVIEMKRVFVSTLRLLAQFAREPVSKDLRVAFERSYSLRETINKNFDSVRAFGDSVLLEFGPSRQQDLAWRSRIVQWQPQLRAVFLLRIALWKYRTQLRSFELPGAVLLAQQEFDNRSADVLDSMADRMEGRASAQHGDIKENFDRLENVIQNCVTGPSQTLSPQLQTFLLLSRKTESLENSLDDLMEREV